MSRGIPLTDIQNTICANLLLLESADREKLCNMTEIPWTTVYDNLEILEKLGIVQRNKAPPEIKVGRPKVYWTLINKKVRVYSKK